MSVNPQNKYKSHRTLNFAVNPQNKYKSHRTLNVGQSSK